MSTRIESPRAVVGDPVHCIQVGHFGLHKAVPTCLCIDAAGLCYTPQVVQS